MRNMCLLILLFGATGCATIANGTRDTVQVVVNYNLPPEITATGVKVFIENQEVPIGGGPITIRRSHKPLSIRATCDKPGYQVVVAPTKVEPNFTGEWFVWDIVLGGIWIFVDLFTGAWWDYPDPLNLSVTVTPLHRH